MELTAEEGMGKDTKEYFLMHKNIKVCLMEISDDGVLGSVRHNEAAADHFHVLQCTL